MRKILLRATLGAALTATIITVPIVWAESDEGSGQRVSDIDWQKCPEGEEVASEGKKVECGTIEVPIEWDDPGGETVELFVVRRPAEKPEKRIGTLVFADGGPGDPSGLKTLFAPQLLSQDLRDRFDMVGIDPRGVGYSEAIQCSEELLNAAPDPYLDNQKEFDERFLYNKKLRADCSEKNGALFGNIDTRDVARDIDAVRAGLGEEQVSLYGISYGTAVGQQYAAEYPERVRSMVLDSNVDHSVGVKKWLELKAEMFQASFDGFVSWCESDERCALNGAPVRDTWHEVLDRADNGEYPDPDDPQRELSSYEVIDTAFRCSYGPDWSPLADYVHALDSGETPPGKTCRGDGGEPPIEIPDSRALNVANFCSDYSLPVRNHRNWESMVQRAGEKYAPDVRYNPNAIDRISDCLGQEDQTTNPQHRLDVDGSGPILLVNPLADPVTGHNQAERAVKQFGPEARLVTYEGAGHGAYGVYNGSDCMTEVVDEHLIEAEFPAEVTSCPAIPYEP